MADKFLIKLSQNLLEILNDNEYYDITIEVGIDPHVEIFRGHMVILNYRSPYLRRILSTNKKKNDGALTHIKLPNILPEIFHVILRYIYGGKISLEEYDTLDIIKILEAANELSLQELIGHLQSFLIKNKTNWLEQNFSLVYGTSFEHETFLELQEFCTDLIIDEPDKIFKSFDFTSIPEKSLVALIQDDNLQVSEVQIWKYVLKWGLAQNPELPSDPAKFSKDDFNILKTTLQHCIPLIRFYNLSSKEFTEKVLPYRKMLPKELYEDLLKTFLNLSDPDSRPSEKSNPRIRHTNKESKLKKINSEIGTSQHDDEDFEIGTSQNLDKSRNKFDPEIVKLLQSSTIFQPDEWITENKKSKINIDSRIVTSQHAELISKWIDRLNITEEIKNSYKFKLLFRGSRDGATKKFHEICDDKYHTLTIVKVKGSNEILGGYNPARWKSDNSWTGTKDSFIFSFKNNEKNDRIEEFVLSRLMDKTKAVYNGYFYGPSFGESDLYIWKPYLLSYRNYCKTQSYEKPIRKTEGRFNMDECEVFQVSLV